MNLHAFGGDKILLTKKLNHIDFQALWVSANVRGINKKNRNKNNTFFVIRKKKKKDKITFREKKIPGYYKL